MTPAASAAVVASEAVAAVRAGQPLLVASFVEWRATARALLRAGVPPEAVTWGEPGADLFSSAPAAPASALETVQPTGDLLAAPPAERVAQATPRPQVPRSLMEMLQTAACYRDHDRWAFLYRVV